MRLALLVRVWLQAKRRHLAAQQRSVANQQSVNVGAAGTQCELSARIKEEGKRGREEEKQRGRDERVQRDQKRQREQKAREASKKLELQRISEQRIQEEDKESDEENAYDLF